METRQYRRRDRSKTSPSNSMLVPYADRHLAVVPAPAVPSHLSIPDGWDVEEVPRPDGSRSDRYYYEPGSGKKFRSTREIRRYLSEQGEQPRQEKPSYSFRSNTTKVVPFEKINQKVEMKLEVRDSSRYLEDHGYLRMMVSGGKLLRVDNEGSKNHLSVIRDAPSILPDGWIVEEIPRKYSNWTDKYYYEPESGQRFRSLVAIEKYLTELEEDAPLSKTLEAILENKPLARAFKLENNKSSAKRKKDISREKSQTPSFIEPPMKVNWVLASAQGDSWNPFISEALVPDAIKQQWTDRFMLFMKGEITNFQD